MHLRLLVPACVLASQVALAQQVSQWRFGAALSAPTRLIEQTSLTAPDSVLGHVDLGLGVGAEVAWAWRIQPGMLGAVHVRATTAPVHSVAAGTSWSPGRAFIVEASTRIEREIGDRTALFGGVGVSHWAGPTQTAPFSGTGAILLGAETGVSVRPVGAQWRVDLSANLTRFAADDARGVATGIVLRWMMGVHRER